MTLLQLVAADGPTVAVGITLLLAVGCACALSARAPVARRWFGVLAAGGAAIYLACALLPLPRWTPLANGAGALASPVLAHARAPAPAERLALAPRAVSGGRLPTSADIASDGTADAVDAMATRDGGDDAEGPDGAVDAEGAEGTWRTWLAVAFVLGAGLALLHRVLGLARLWWILRTSRPAPDRLVALAPASVAVRIARSAVRPFCCGQVRGAIVLPPALAAVDRHDVAAAVLAHEIAHLRAGDQRVQALFAWLGVALFWHPLFRWLARDVRLQCELLADAAAAGADAPRYARAMLDLASGLPAPRAALPATVPVFGRPSEFYRRLHMLLHRQDPLSPCLDRRARWLPALAFPLLAAGSAVVFGVAPARAQEPVARDPAPQQPAPPVPQAGAASAVEAERVVAELHATIEDLRRTIESLQARPVLGSLVNDPDLGNSREPILRPVEESRDVDVVSTRVARGDTLQSILQRANGGRKPDAELLQRTMDLNPQLDPRRLRIGEVVTMHIPRQHAQDPRADGAPSVRGGGGSKPAHGAATSAPAFRAGNVTDDGLFELHALVSRCIELRGEVDMAKVRVEAASSDVDRRLAEIRLRTLERQLDLAEQVVRGERERLEKRLLVLHRMHEQGLVPVGEPQRIESFVKILFDTF